MLHEGRKVRIAAAAALMLAAVVLAIIALTGGFASSHVKRRQAAGSLPNLPQCGLTISAGSDPTSQIVAALRRYSCAFSNHDVSAMQALFTPDIYRRALRNGGCDTTRGRADVVAVYRDEEFATTNGEYALRPKNLAPRVKLDGPQAATVAATFLITQGGAGPISFGLRKTSEGWQISRVLTRC